MNDLATNAGAPTLTSTGASPLLFQPNTATRPIIVGGSDSAGSLVYSDTDNAATCGSAKKDSRSLTDKLLSAMVRA